MVSVSGFKTASNGASYFEKDSYYQHENGTSEWYGKGAEELGLDGGVREEDFSKVLNGFDADSKPLVKNAGKEDVLDENGKIEKIGHRAYVDMTFSAPKSVSIMSYVDPRIEAAHNRAVEKTIKELESNYSHTRMVQEGELRTVRCDNLCMVRFNHYESRELDPQLHSHVVVMNLTKGEDGKWRSLETGDMYKNQLYFGQHYRNEMAKEMRELGYEIEVTDRNKGLYEIKGVDKEIVDEFSTRRKQIEESREKYENYSVSEARKMEYACLDSRRPKTDSKIEEIRQDVENRLGKYGKSLESLKAQSLEQAREKKQPEFSGRQCVSFALEEVTDKQSGFRREEVLAHAMKAGIGHYSAEEIKGEFSERSEVQELGSRTGYAGKTRTAEVTYYTTEEIRRTEAGIVKWAKEGRGSSNIAVSGNTVKSHVEAIAEGRKLTWGQREAVEMICTTRDRLSLVQGDAGSGKSYACDHVRQIMGKEGIGVRGFAPTGKASEELSKAGIESKTVDSFLESAKLGKTGVGKGEVWLVDEAGMMGSRKLAKFLQEAQEHEAKVVLIGDTKQFKSIEQGRIFADLQEHAGVSKVEVVEIKRQESEHAREIVKAIKERDFDRAFETLERYGAFKEVANREERNRRIVDEYLADRKSGVSSAVLTSTNADRNDINRQIRERLEKEGAVDSGKEYKTFQKADLNAVSRNFAASYKEGQAVVFKSDCEGIKRGTQARIGERDSEKNRLIVKYYDKESKGYKEASIDCREHSAKMQVYDVVDKKFGVGEKVIFQKNDTAVGVKNGQTGVVESIDKEGMAKIRIDRNKTVECNLNNKGDRAYTYLDHAYCITSHKSQGSTYDKCIAAYDVSSHKTNFNEFYVAATRQRQDVTIYTNDKAKFREQVQEEQDKISTLDPVFRKFESRLEENRQEASREARAELQATTIDMHEAKEGQQQKAPEQKQNVKERDYGMEL